MRKEEFTVILVARPSHLHTTTMLKPILPPGMREEREDDKREKRVKIGQEGKRAHHYIYTRDVTCIQLLFVSVTIHNYVDTQSVLLCARSTPV